MSFFVELWNSIFTPGTTPQLVIATHASFIALFITLGWLIFVTKGNIHFIALLVIAVLLWISIIWFINELKNVNLQDNTQLEESSSSTKKDESEKDEHEKDDDKKDSSNETNTTALNKKNLKSRKV